ncbi:hypothetical protein AA0229_1496 [Gluconobacter cerinus NRIC 0229]|nr:hypothetical protein AA0229_1496 [Gluconobacter cerinus NRIC 0229]
MNKLAFLGLISGFKMHMLAITDQSLNGNNGVSPFRQNSSRHDIKAGRSIWQRTRGYPCALDTMAAQNCACAITVSHAIHHDPVIRRLITFGMDTLLQDAARSLCQWNMFSSKMTCISENKVHGLRDAQEFNQFPLH